jgi:hypothetical protein
MRQLRLDECRGWMTAPISVVLYRQRRAREYPVQAQLWSPEPNVNQVVLVKGGPGFPRPPRDLCARLKNSRQFRLGSSRESCRLVLVEPPLSPRLARRHQTRLRRSATNQLRLVFTKLDEQEQVEDKSLPLSSLPNELLLGIFGLATKPDMLSLSIVCHRFHHLVNPLLYQSLGLIIGWRAQFDADDDLEHGCYGLVPGQRWPLRLYRTLRQNPALRQHCRELHLSLESSERLGYLNLSHAVDVVTWLENAVCLRLTKTVDEGRDYTGEETWALIRAVTQHRKGALQDLHLFGYLGLRLTEACLILAELPNLKALHLDGVWDSSDMLLSQNAWRADPSLSLSLSSLSIGCYHDSRENLRQFLVIPAQLEHFTFTGSTDVDSEHHSTPTFPFLVSALSRHMTTLRTLAIHTYYVLSPVPADLSRFTSLNELTLSLSTTGTAQDSVAEILTAPSLYKFRWAISDWQRQDLFGFGASEENWLRCLARAAATGGSRLREIELDWRPTRTDGPPFSRRPTNKPEIYPWARLEGLRQELIQDHGKNCISLSWSPPTVAKEAFLRWDGLGAPCFESQAHETRGEQFRYRQLRLRF